MGKAFFEQNQGLVARIDSLEGENRTLTDELSRLKMVSDELPLIITSTISLMILIFGGFWLVISASR
jgi:hypothetical protein